MFTVEDLYRITLKKLWLLIVDICSGGDIPAAVAALLGRVLAPGSDAWRKCLNIYKEYAASMDHTWTIICETLYFMCATLNNHPSPTMYSLWSIDVVPLTNSSQLMCLAALSGLPRRYQCRRGAGKLRRYAHYTLVVIKYILWHSYWYWLE